MWLPHTGECPAIDRSNHVRKLIAVRVGMPSQQYQVHELITCLQAEEAIISGIVL